MYLIVENLWLKIDSDKAIIRVRRDERKNLAHSQYHSAMMVAFASYLNLSACVLPHPTVIEKLKFLLPSVSSFGAFDLRYTTTKQVHNQTITHILIYILITVSCELMSQFL